MKKENITADLKASLVVFLVALPLCLGIALASGAPSFAGIIAGIVGGLIVGSLSGSNLSVSGPAAGLTVVVADSIKACQTYEAFLLAVVLSGVFQILLGLLKAGKMANFFPIAVIRGMLAAIGLILIMKQLPHALGYDFDFAGDENFEEAKGHNTFTDIYYAVLSPNKLAIIISICALVLMNFWDNYLIKWLKFLRFVPGALMAVVAGISINALAPEFMQLQQEHLVSLPTNILNGSIGDVFAFPNFSALNMPAVYKVALTIALIASVESLLSVEATDQLDPSHFISPTNRELIAQGSGNIVSGLLGGIPVTAVIVRSSANILAGAKTRISAIAHAVLLTLTVVFIPGILNLIPLSALAAILLTVGYKLTKPEIFKQTWKKGFDQFIPFVITIIAIVFTDLLRGIGIGLIVALFYILRTNIRRSVYVVNDGNNYLVRLNHNVSFINKDILRRNLYAIPTNSHVIIDGTAAAFVDTDIIDTIETFQKAAKVKHIHVEIKRSESSSHPFFRKQL
jgi:MFS superfamily sulfate permease-like transporter